MPLTRTSTKNQSVFLDTTIPHKPRLVVRVPSKKQTTIASELDRLLRARNDVFVQTVILDALRIAVEQEYFWTPGWQTKERAADRAIAAGRVRTFDTIDKMIKFLDRQ